MSCLRRFTPLQILALVAVETVKLEEIGFEKTRAMVLTVIQSIAQILLMNGARTNVAPPPPSRLDRMIPKGCYSLKEALECKHESSSVQLGDRNELRLDGNVELMTLLGGADNMKTFL